MVDGFELDKLDMSEPYDFFCSMVLAKPLNDKLVHSDAMEYIENLFSDDNMEVSAIGGAFGIFSINPKFLRNNMELSMLILPQLASNIYNCSGIDVKIISGDYELFIGGSDITEDCIGLTKYSPLRKELYSKPKILKTYTQHTTAYDMTEAFVEKVGLSTPQSHFKYE